MKKGVARAGIAAHMLNIDEEHNSKAHGLKREPAMPSDRAALEQSGSPPLVDPALAGMVLRLPFM